MTAELDRGVGRLSLTLELPVAGEAVWERATRIAGVNEELRPLLRMTAPRDLREATIAELRPGAPVGRSWLLLGGVLPVDYDDLCLAEIEPPRRFLERSRMLSMAAWEHERVIEPRGADACTLTDRLRFELRPLLARVPGSARIAAALVGFLFRHRHRRLARIHGVAEAR